MDRVDQAYLDELLSSTGTNEDDHRTDNRIDPEPESSYEEIKEMAKGMGCGDRDHDMNVIMKFIEVRLLFIAYRRVYLHVLLIRVCGKIKRVASRLFGVVPNRRGEAVNLKSNAARVSYDFVRNSKAYFLSPV